MAGRALGTLRLSCTLRQREMAHRSAVEVTQHECHSLSETSYALVKGGAGRVTSIEGCGCLACAF